MKSKKSIPEPAGEPKNRKNKSFLKVITLVVGPLRTNCYLVFDKQTKETLIIDPGDDAEFLKQTILDLGLKPIGLLATHGHFDHTLAAEELRLTLKVPFFLHPGDQIVLGKIPRYLGQVLLGTPSRITPVKEGKTIKIGRAKLKVMATPGHTPGSICLFSAQEGFLFTGDLVFKGGLIGRWDLPFASQKAVISSIKKLLRLPGNPLVYPGHGEKTTFKQLKKDLNQTSTMKNQLPCVKIKP